MHHRIMIYSVHKKEQPPSKVVNLPELAISLPRIGQNYKAGLFFSLIIPIIYIGKQCNEKRTTQK